jgi:hypothetical protein
MPDGPGQVLFFDHDALIGTPTPDPRPYIASSRPGTPSACSTSGSRATTSRAAPRASALCDSSSPTAAHGAGPGAQLLRPRGALFRRDGA